MTHDFSEKLDRKGTNCWKWDREGIDILYPMGVADTDFRIAKPIADALIEKINSGALAYGAGPQEFFAAISSYYQRRYDFSISTDEVRAAPGLMILLQMFCEIYTMPGDKVILQPPVYHCFRSAVEKSGRQVLDNCLVYDKKENTYCIDFEDLEEKAKNPHATMMVICNPHNPIGRAWTKEELLKIFDICNKNDVLVVSDEVHSDIYYDDYKHTPFLSISEKARENAILMSADGKTFNLHSFYTSFALIPNEKMRKKYERAFEYRHMDYSDVGCVAAEVAYNGSCDYYIDGLVDYLQENRDYLVDFLNNNDIGVTVTKPQATYLMWLNFEKWNMNCQTLSKSLSEYGVGLEKGIAFGVGGEGFMRMNIACHRDTLIGALDCIKKLYEERISNI